ncbi:cell division transport system permease protein [Legionella beliardensis]|uniref:Cell division protein FtsX n=1 Tax=Legionella beliardensis TaxID=91822 RepID=A0A378IC13_9GAMM|nr:permease-like cell division protein FtsX [Legionella beliardensis]STX29834.1 cell division transport system permease protein [Legionella beliardensis]
MLKKLKALISYHLQAATFSFSALYRTPLATMLTVIVIAITLTLPSLFWVITDNLKQLTANLQGSGHISLYLKTSLSSKEENDSLIQVRALDGVGHANLKTKAQGLAELEQQEGMREIMHSLAENPLPAVIEVVPAPTINDPLKINQLFERLKSLPQVEQAKLDMQWITRLHAILGFVGKIAHAIIILLALAVVLIIGNSLRLALHNRKGEVQLLKLIGATDAFILRPFLYTGIWYGMLGAIFAVFFINIFMLSVAIAVRELSSAYHMHYPLLGLSVRQAYLIVFAAIFLGWLGARLTIKRQLSSIEPYT